MMARWETNWPVKRANVRNETREEARKTSASVGLWMLFCAFVFGMSMREIVGGLLFVWRLAYGGH